MENDVEVVMIGAGAMGGVIAGALARAGVRLSIIDTDAAHVAAIDRDGLCVEGLVEGMPLRLPATTAPAREAFADLAVVMTPAYETANTARTAARVLKPEGAAVSMQNGLGNAEVLVEVLGAGRVFMGSTRASADRPAPGRPRVTRIDPSRVGELNGAPLPRTRWLAERLTEGGMPTEVSDNIMGVLWSKFMHNCASNAISAITGLTLGEVSRMPGVSRLRWQVIDEAMAVSRAKGIVLEYPDPIPALKRHTWRKFTKPSMLQHIEAGRPIEIDALNGWLVREAEAMGIDVPVNRIVAALARGRALGAQRAKSPPDYRALAAEAEAEIARGETPWDQVL
ncbi:MAG TPA: ketopantoate reductase family protein [Paracoccaceae bacterium]|nr:ketopantoate reductase family protein [Paracoccaceae bacterium]